MNDPSYRDRIDEMWDDLKNANDLTPKQKGCVVGAIAHDLLSKEASHADIEAYIEKKVGGL